MPLTIDLSGRKALVTGASDGIGFGVACAFARAGCRIVGAGSVPIDHPRAVALTESVARMGGSATYLAGDLRDSGVPANIVLKAAESLGGLDIVISNAGRNSFKGASKATEQDWNECMNLNLASHWRIARAARPHLEKASPGVLVLMGSNHAFASIPGCFPYNVAKAGMVGLVNALAIEWGPAVRVVGLAPGFIETAGNQAWFDSFPDPAAERARTVGLHPVGRIGTPEEVGALCAFLASPLAGFIAGTTLLMDGGRSALMQDGENYRPLGATNNI
jgi:NAD(P)-dependent dehydrogenase (short-subunit alcohol dehydrogenase family)